MHKFHLGQMVDYRPARGIYAPRGPYIVTLKLPEQDGEFAYHIRNVIEQHERIARESELLVMAIDDNAPRKKRQ
jgi:hypothetical protein